MMRYKKRTADSTQAAFKLITAGEEFQILARGIIIKQ
jgi:hypothetical protein